MVLTKWRILVSAGNSSKLPETPPKRLQMDSNCLWDCLCGFRVNSQGSEIGRFWAKTLGYSPWFWLMADFGKCRKSLQTPCNVAYMLADGFLTVIGLVPKYFGWIRKGPKLADFVWSKFGKCPPTSLKVISQQSCKSCSAGFTLVRNNINAVPGTTSDRRGFYLRRP